MRAALAALAFVVWSGGGAAAQPEPGETDPVEPAPVSDQRNAAIEYGVFWSLLSRHIASKLPTPNQLAADPGLVRTELDEVLARAWVQSELDELATITAMPFCDFELEYELGHALPLEHLFMYRWTVSSNVADARRHRRAADTDAATRRLVAALGAVRHAGAERNTVTAGVARASTEAVLVEIEGMLDAGEVDRAAAVRLLSGLDLIPSADPFGFVGGMRRWPAFCRASALDLLGAELGVGGGILEIRGLSSEAPRRPETDEERALVEREMGGVERAVAETIRAWEDDDEPALLVVGKAIFDGRYGRLAAQGLGSAIGSKRDELALVERFGAVRDRLAEFSTD